jgi:hypothetical protein
MRGAVIKSEESRADNVRLPAAAPFLATQLRWVYRATRQLEIPAGGVKDMASPFRRMRGCRVTPVVLALAWLPYIATRCVENPLTHTCVMMAAMAHNAGTAHAHSPGAATSGQHSHCHGDKHAPARGCCCDLADKCDIEDSSGVPLTAPALLVAASPVASDIILDGHSFGPGGFLTVAHGPPTYLRNLSLRF